MELQGWVSGVGTFRLEGWVRWVVGESWGVGVRGISYGWGISFRRWGELLVGGYELVCVFYYFYLRSPHIYRKIVLDHQ